MAPRPTLAITTPEIEMYRRALVLTCDAPRSELASSGHGIHQRLSAFLSAISSLTEQIDLVAIFRLGPRELLQVSAHDLEVFYRSLSGADVSVRIVVVRSSAKGEGRLSMALRGLLDPYRARKDPADAYQTNGEAPAVRERYDFVFLHRLASFANLHHVATERHRLVMDLDDIEHRAAYRLWRMPPRYPGKVFEFPRILGLAALERRAINACATTFICSETDQGWLRSALRATKVDVLPNSVMERPDARAADSTHTVLFVGLLGYEPNREGVQWLLSEIWPKVVRNVPTAQLRIAGKLPAGAAGSFASSNDSTWFLGFVDDIAAEYARAQLVVCPIRAGGGTRIKIVEAAMHRRAVVSTTIGAEGLGFRSPDEISIRDDPSEFAEEICRLLEDTAACDSLARRARHRALAEYGRSQFTSRFAQALSRALGP